MIKRAIWSTGYDLLLTNHDRKIYGSRLRSNHRISLSLFSTESGEIPEAGTKSADPWNKEHILLKLAGTTPLRVPTNWIRFRNQRVRTNSKSIGKPGEEKQTSRDQNDKSNQWYSGNYSHADEMVFASWNQQLSKIESDRDLQDIRYERRRARRATHNLFDVEKIPVMPEKRSLLDALSLALNRGMHGVYVDENEVSSVSAESFTKMASFQQIDEFFKHLITLDSVEQVASRLAGWTGSEGTLPEHLRVLVRAALLRLIRERHFRADQIAQLYDLQLVESWDLFDAVERMRAVFCVEANRFDGVIEILENTENTSPEHLEAIIYAVLNAQRWSPTEAQECCAKLLASPRVTDLKLSLRIFDKMMKSIVYVPSSSINQSNPGSAEIRKTASPSDFNQIFLVLKEMLARGIFPRPNTFGILFLGCQTSAEFVVVFKIIKQMIKAKNLHVSALTPISLFYLEALIRISSKVHKSELHHVSQEPTESESDELQPFLQVYSKAEKEVNQVKSLFSVKEFASSLEKRRNTASKTQRDSLQNALKFSKRAAKSAMGSGPRAHSVSYLFVSRYWESMVKLCTEYDVPVSKQAIALMVRFSCKNEALFAAFTNVLLGRRLFMNVIDHKTFKELLEGIDRTGLPTKEFKFILFCASFAEWSLDDEDVVLLFRALISQRDAACDPMVFELYSKVSKRINEGIGEGGTSAPLNPKVDSLISLRQRVEAELIRFHVMNGDFEQASATFLELQSSDSNSLQALLNLLERRRRRWALSEEPSEPVAFRAKVDRQLSVFLSTLMDQRMNWDLLGSDTMPVLSKAVVQWSKSVGSYDTFCRELKSRMLFDSTSAAWSTLPAEVGKKFTEFVAGLESLEASSSSTKGLGGKGSDEVATACMTNILKTIKTARQNGSDHLERSIARLVDENLVDRR